VEFTTCEGDMMVQLQGALVSFTSFDTYLHFAPRLQ